MEDRRHWIQFSNTLTAPDKARVRKTVAALRNNEQPLPFTPQPSLGGGHCDEPLRAGAGRAQQRRRTPPCRATAFRAFYRVHPDGRKYSTARYCVYQGGALGLAEELLMKLCDSRAAGGSTSIPPSVTDAVQEAERQGVVTRRQADAYLKKYSKYKLHTHVMTLHLREQGKQAVRQYQGGYRMLKHPSTNDVMHGHVRRFTVHHVDTFRA